MLQSVDAPRMVARPDGSWADISVHGLKKVPGIGPQGWKMVADEILGQIAQ
jgi:hypothetical protein